MGTLDLGPNCLQQNWQDKSFCFLFFPQVLAEKEHKIKDRKIDPKRANPRGDKENKKKIFVGKVDPNTAEETLRNYFEQYGKVRFLVPLD